MLQTRITRQFGIRYPVMSAPMGMFSGGRIAAAVSKAGGLGMFGGTNPSGPDWVREQVRYIRSQTDKPFGVGFITHINPALPDLFEVALEEKVPVIAFSFADPSPWLARAKENGAVTICQVQTLEDARLAVEAGTDILVAQGNEAGGHTGKMNLLPLLTLLIDRYPGLPVIAAGGIASGRALAAVLAAGAEGALVGTSFMATPECTEVPDTYKQIIVESSGENTVFTRVYDILDPAIFKIPEWPEGIAARALNNRFVQEWHGREDELKTNLDQVIPIYLKAMEKRDPDISAVYFGQSADFIKAVRPAEQVLKEMCDEAEAVLRGGLEILAD